MQFSVSVIIPVYNAERFIEKAISSVLLQPEVLEVVVVNDGSTDKTQNILEKLKEENPIIKVCHHQNKLNKGRSVSRNLGIKKATGNYIAFLDADDFYLPNRFTNDKKVFDENKKADGVYNAIGVHFYREATNIEKDKLKLTTVTERIKPEELFETLLFYKKGHFSVDGLTLKKEVFAMAGYFDESLKVAEDTNLILRIALKCQLVAGIIDKPVAMRGVHNSNVFDKKDLYDKQNIRVYESLFFWSASSKVELKKIDNILNLLWIFKYGQNAGLIKNSFYWFYLFFKKPKLLFSTLSIKYFPVVRLRKKLFPFLHKQS